MAYQAQGGSNFSRQMMLAFRMQKPMAKESGECVVRGISGRTQLCEAPKLGCLTTQI
jgi:hypothetical protein